ncbi:MAG TPA: transglycosylase domain-containing protein [Terriglobia bacterium]|nr:transglycosylase domain-containing protein [Terriglobia bacterium]
MFSRVAARLSYGIGPGPSPRIAFPESGPFNEARGYSKLPEFERELMDAGYHIVEQVRLSPELEGLAHWRITPPYHEQAAAGLTIRGENGITLYDADSIDRVFRNYDEIPPLVVKALLFVENRELEDSSVASRNPVVDWSRLVKAGVLYAGHKLGLPVRIEGGSTLATQIEKFRYADGGRTSSATDKLRQMVSASLRVYRSGPDTSAERREIVLDYLNSVPLAAASDYGEVNGLGAGLHAWFGIELKQALSVMNAASQKDKARIIKDILALICSARAPSFYLKEDRAALEARVQYYARQLENVGAISENLARAVQSAPLEFLTRAPAAPPVPYVQRKATNAFRAHMMTVLGVRDLYALDRLNLDADTTLNIRLQNDVLAFFQKLKDPVFIEAQGLRQPHLLLRGDPSQVMYSFTLFERTPAGNVLRIQADTLNQPFDLNEGMKLELGSTAKLRTLAHYLEVVASLFHQFHELDAPALKQLAQGARDPITRWTAETMGADAGLDLDTLLETSLDRRYSGSPGELFFTGGGQHVFANFDKKENGQSYTLREGLQHSVNLVYIRLMRDLVRFHQARLPYDMEAVLDQSDHPERLRMLNEISEKESEHFLYEAYRAYRGLKPDAIVGQMLGTRNRSARHLAMLFLSWNPAANKDTLADWLQSNGSAVSGDEAARLFKGYDPGRLNMADYGYLLGRHPLDVWCAGQMMQEPNVSWDDLLQRSAAVRTLASRWLFQTRNRRAQDLRLRIRFEQDAFARMTPYWQRLAFPFDRLVPSLATAIGSSADRPAALAELMGIILNDGVRLPTVRVRQLRFAGDTPYETVFQPNQQSGERVMEPAVAHALYQVLADVVEKGTASRLAGAFTSGDGKLVVTGGKTGSGDNRFETFGRGGYVKSSRAVSRTGTFVFYIGDRYFGVLTAYVGGDKAGNYVFTSALPVAALKLLAPTIAPTLNGVE